MHISTQIAKCGRPQTVSLSSVASVKAFFRQYDLPYVDNDSRNKNILDNIQKLPTDTPCIYVFESISFFVRQGTTYQFSDNYRLKNCEVVGDGEFYFKSDVLAHEEIVLEHDFQLREILGVYYPEKSVVWNIKQAERAGNWPVTGDVVLVEMCLDVKEAEPISLPINAHPKDCFIKEGHVVITSGVMKVCGENAIGEANSCLAKIVASDGKAYARNAGSAYAIENGAAFALHDGTTAYADGPKAKAVGMQNGSMIIVSNGATGYKHTEGVITKCDEHPDSKILKSAVHGEAPPVYYGEKVLIETDRYKNYRDYVLELKDLADLGCTESVFKLAMIEDVKLKTILPTIDKPHEFFMSKSVQQLAGRPVEICEFFMARYRVSYREAQRWGERNSCYPQEYSRNGYLYVRTNPTVFYGGFEYYCCYSRLQIEGNQSHRIEAEKHFKLAKEKGLIDNSMSFYQYERNFQEANQEANSSCTLL